MAASNVRVPPDSTGKFIRTWDRTVAATLVQEHFFHNAHGESAVLANIAISATNVTLQALNQQRIGWSVFNDGDVETLFIKLGATASVTSFTVAVPPRGSWTLDVPYAGLIDGLWSGTTGLALGGGAPAARVTEVTP